MKKPNVIDNPQPVRSKSEVGLIQDISLHALLIIVGFCIWLLFILFAPRSSGGLMLTVENILLLAVLVNTPFAWQLASQPATEVSLVHTLPLFLASSAVLIAFSLPAGFIAALWSLPWLACTIFLGLGRWRNVRSHRLDERAIDVGILYLCIGAGWLVISRAGMQPIEFSAIIVLLTAVHFHYTGFAVPVLTGLLGRFLQTKNLNYQSYPWLTGGILAATPLIAIGITISPTVEIVGVGLLVISMLTLAYNTGVIVIDQIEVWLAKGLLLISALSMILAIALAAMYGLGEFLNRQFITLPQMVAYHGWTNAVGTVFCGLWGWGISGQVFAIRD